MPEPQGEEKLIEFLNLLAGKFIKISNRANRQNLKEVIGEVADIVMDLKTGLKEIKISNMPEIINRFPDKIEAPEMKQINIEMPQFPKRIEVSNFPPFPKIPDRMTVDEIQDVLKLLQTIIDKLAERRIFKVNFAELESRIIDVGEEIRRMGEKVSRSMPVVPRMPEMPRIPIDRGAVRGRVVNWPEFKTPLGEKIGNLAKGIFLGGGASNTQTGLSNRQGNPINPATEETLKDVLENIGVSTSDEIGDGIQTVAVAGTAVKLSAITVPCKKVFVQAHEENTGTIVIGGENVVAALADRRGKAFYATQGDWFNVSNLNLLYVDSTVGGDKVHYYYEN